MPRAAVVIADLVVVPTLPSRPDIVSDRSPTPSVAAGATEDCLREGHRHRPGFQGASGRRPSQPGAGRHRHEPPVAGLHAVISVDTKKKELIAVPQRRRSTCMAAQPTFAAVLHQYVAYREAFALGQSVIEYDAASKAASEMLALQAELDEGSYPTGREVTEDHHELLEML